MSDDIYLVAFIIGATLVGGSVLAICLQCCCGKEIREYLCENDANGPSEGGAQVSMV